MAENEIVLLRKELNEMKVEMNKLRNRLSRVESHCFGTVDHTEHRKEEERKKGIERIL